MAKGFPREALEALEDLSEHTRAALPTLEVSEATWVSRLRGVLDPLDAALVASLPSLRAADLYLGCALEGQDPAALEIFERALVPHIDRAIESFATSADHRDELRQRVRIRVLVSTDGGPAKISQYSGRGSLAGWLRTIAARVALNEARNGRPHDDLDEVPEVGIRDTPEFSRMREEHRGLFMDCLRAAFTELEPRQRAIVRLHHGNQMTAVALARSYSVHESTMSRWLASARVAMAENFERLATEAVAERGAADQLLAVMQSRLDMSLQSLFATRPPTPDDASPQ